jgi:hypothetical protein
VWLIAAVPQLTQQQQDSLSELLKDPLFDQQVRNAARDLI